MASTTRCLYHTVLGSYQQQQQAITDDHRMSSRLSASSSSGLSFERRAVAAVSATAFRRQFSWSVMSKLNSPLVGVGQGSLYGVRSANTAFLGCRIVVLGSELGVQWSFIGGTKVMCQPEATRLICRRKASSPAACWFTNTQIASNAFTWATASVLPFYTLMVLAPNAAVTKRAMKSSAPYVMLGILYAYLLYLSWTPDMLRTMFASKYWLPELPGIAKLFMNEMTVSSAWIHLLAVDLFAARQVFQDGLKNKIETRHSVSLCLLFCPVGILAHIITKELTNGGQNRSH